MFCRCLLMLPSQDEYKMRINSSSLLVFLLCVPMHVIAWIVFYPESFMVGPCGGAGAGQRPPVPDKSRGRGPGSGTTAKGASFIKKTLVNPK